MRLASPEAATRRAARRLLSAARDDRGSISVEYALWMSLFAAVFTLVADLTSIFTANSAMWHAGHDAARRLSVSEMTVEEVRAHVRDSLGPRFGETVRVDAWATDPVVVEIAVPFAEATVFGMVPGLDSGELVTRLVMRDEIAAIEQIRAAAEQAAGEDLLASGAGG